MKIIIIGAGASGLMASKELSTAGNNVIILEARDRIGGRINTITDTPKNHHENGAEFIHGKLPVTLALLKEAGIRKRKSGGKAMQLLKGKWQEERDFFEHSDLVAKRLKELTEDMSIADFLKKYFSAKKHHRLRKSLTDYIEGYYSGTIEKCSALSFLLEFESEDEEQYRPEGGYMMLMQYLLNTCLKSGGSLHLNTVVKEITWQKNQVEVTTNNKKKFLANKVLVTIPIGVWASRSGAKGNIQFTPSLPEKVKAAKQMGFGSVIKILCCFDEVLTANEQIQKKSGVTLDDVGFLLTDKKVPTWWTQFPEQSPLLTGWLAGPKAALLKNESDETIFEMALQSLSEILKVDNATLKEKLLWWKVINWTKDPFTRGAYSYSTLQTKEARKILNKPVETTLYFAGEAHYDGTEMGTVEAALTSGKNTSTLIIEDL